MQPKVTVLTNLESNSYSLNTLQQLLHSGCDGNVIYEFHTIEGSTNENGIEHFRQRNEINYANIISDFPIDQWSADISYAVKLADIWYFSLHSGANDYGGTVPTMVTEFRTFLKDKGIKILAKEGLHEWLLQNFPNHPEVSDFILDKYFTFSEQKILDLLSKFNFEQTKTHFSEATDNIKNRNWASANGQIRTFIESLFCEIAKHKTKNDCKTFAVAIKLLTSSTTPPFLKTELNEVPNTEKGKSFLDGLWVRLHPQGSHPGIPEIDDCIFRQQIAMLTADLLLRRL